MCCNGLYIAEADSICDVSLRKKPTINKENLQVNTDTAITVKFMPVLQVNIYDHERGNEYTGWQIRYIS